MFLLGPNLTMREQACLDDLAPAYGLVLFHLMTRACGPCSSSTPGRQRILKYYWTARRGDRVVGARWSGGGWSWRPALRDGRWMPHARVTAQPSPSDQVGRRTYGGTPTAHRPSRSRSYRVLNNESANGRRCRRQFTARRRPVSSSLSTSRPVRTLASCGAAGDGRPVGSDVRATSRPQTAW
jgi:hypothetical protein